jgi:hypothetical protein
MECLPGRRSLSQNIAIQHLWEEGSSGRVQEEKGKMTNLEKNFHPTPAAIGWGIVSDGLFTSLSEVCEPLSKANPESIAPLILLNAFIDCPYGTAFRTL